MRQKKFFVPIISRIAFNSMALMLCTVKTSILFDTFFKLVAISTIETDTCFLLLILS